METNKYKKKKQVLEKFMGKNPYIKLYKSMIQKIDRDNSIVLLDLISREEYFKKKRKLDKQGYFFSKQLIRAQELRYSMYEMTKIEKALEQLETIETKRKGIPAKKYYKINYLRIQEIVTCFPDLPLKNKTPILVSSYLKIKELETKPLSNYINNKNNINENNNKILSKDNIYISGEMYKKNEKIEKAIGESSLKKKRTKLSPNELEKIQGKIERNKTTRKAIKRWNELPKVTKHKDPSKTWLNILRNINRLKAGKLAEFHFEEDFLKRNKIERKLLSKKFTEKEILSTLKKIPSFLEEGKFLSKKDFSKSLDNIIYNKFSPKIPSLFLIAYISDAKPVAENIQVKCKFPEVLRVIQSKFPEISINFETQTNKEKRNFNKTFTEIEKRVAACIADSRKRNYDLSTIQNLTTWVQVYGRILHDHHFNSVIKNGELSFFYFYPNSWTYEKICKGDWASINQMTRIMLQES